MTSNTIYTSDKITPYVYMCIHKISGKFYIGSRYSSRLKYPSDVDFPQYKTSAPYIKQDFDSYKWIILAEFFLETASIDAYVHEQELIRHYWGNPDLLNKCCHLKDTKYKYDDKKILIKKNIKRKPMRQESKDKISKSNKNKTISEETKIKMSLAKKDKPLSEKTKLHLEKLHTKVRDKYVDDPLYKEKLSNAQSGKVLYNNGIISKWFKNEEIPEGWIKGRHKT